MPDQKFSEATLITYLNSEATDRIPVSHDLDAGGTPVDRAMQLGELASKGEARTGILEWSATDQGMIATLRLDDTNGFGEFFEGAKRYFTHADSVFLGKVARRNGTPIDHSSTTHTVADYFEEMDWGGATADSGLSLTLLGTSATLTGTAANIPKVGGGNITRADLGDVFLIDVSYTRTNTNLRMSGIILKSDLAGTAEYRFQAQGAGGDYIAFQFDAAGDTANLTAEEDSNNLTNVVARIYAIVTQSPKGDKGDPGSGSTIIVQEDGTALQTQATTLNFGDGITAAGTGDVKTISVAVPEASGSVTWLRPSADAQRASTISTEVGYTAFNTLTQATTALAAVSSPEEGDIAIAGFADARQINFRTWSYDSARWVAVSNYNSGHLSGETATTSIFYGTTDDNSGGVEFGRLRGETSASYPVSGDRTITANGPTENLIVDGMDFGVDAEDGDYLLVEYHIAELTGLSTPQFAVNESAGGTYLGQSPDLETGGTRYSVMELDAATGRTLRLNLLTSKTGAANGVVRMNVNRVTLFSDSNRSAVEAAEVANDYLASQLTPASAEIALWRLGLNILAGQTFQYLFHLYTALQDHVSSLATEPGTAGAVGVWQAVDNQYANEVPTTIVDQGTKTTVQSWLEYLDGKAVPPDAADEISTDAAPPGGTHANVQRWLDYYGAGVPLHKAYWSEGVPNNSFTAPDTFEALVADLTSLGTLAHGDTLLIEITANIPSTATYHINLQYKQATGNSDTLSSVDIPLTDGHQVIAHDIAYADTTQTRGKLDIDGAVTGTGSGSVRVDSIVHFDGSLSGKDKQTIGSLVGLLEERLEVIERFRGLWNGRLAYYVGQMVIHNLNLYICIRDVPARPSPQLANDGPRVSTDYWEAVSAYQGEWRSGNWYGAGNTFLYTLNADQYNEEQQLYLVVDRIDGTTASTAPPNNPNVVRIDTAGAIAQIADWAKTGNVSAIPAAKLPQVQITRRNARMVVNYDGGDVANEFQFPTASATLDGAMAAADKSKLNDIQENAQRHIQTDWDLAGNVDGGILNKPALAPSNAQQNVQADWEETDPTSDAYILHKPSGTGGTQRTFPEIATGLNALTDDERVSYNSLRDKVPPSSTEQDGTMSATQALKLSQLNQWTVNSEWENDHDYVVGDIVVKFTRMIRCTQAHTSATGSSNDPSYSGVTNGFWEHILHTVIQVNQSGSAYVLLDHTGSLTGREYNSVGMVYGGSWVAPNQQQQQQVYRWQSVRVHSGATYVCTDPHTATLADPKEPGTTGGAAYWDVLP